MVIYLSVAMISVISKPDTYQKLQILSADAQYDLACACSGDKDQHRVRGSEGRWIYPVTLANGGRSVLFKTLLSNVCTNDCKYCPLRAENDVHRCSLSPDETARVFLDYLRRKKVFGLFLSSAVIKTPDWTMQRLNAVAQILRKNHKFAGYIHLKVIPGCSDAAIEQSLSLANTVSVNIETPGEANLQRLSEKKDYLRDIIRPIKLISKLTAKGNKYEQKHQTTQFIVGAANESDAEIVRYTAALYKRLGMGRVYFSAYQKGLGESSLPAEQSSRDNPRDAFCREHRLYQVDFLLRKYGFDAGEITFDRNGRLPLDMDPKETWAKNHPGFFPVNINSAPKDHLLRVPGLGPVTVGRIMRMRRQAPIRRINDIGRFTSRSAKANEYVAF